MKVVDANKVELAGRKNQRGKLRWAEVGRTLAAMKSGEALTIPLAGQVVNGARYPHSLANVVAATITGARNNGCRIIARMTEKGETAFICERA